MKCVVASCMFWTSSTALQCMDSDLQKIQAYNPPALLPPQPNWEDLVEKCQREAYIHDDDAVFASCVSKYVDGLSDSCLQCERRQDPFADAAQDCKVECLLGWCKSGCQACIFKDGAFNYTNPCDGATREIEPEDPCASSFEQSLADNDLACVESDLEKIQAYHPEPGLLPAGLTWEQAVMKCQEEPCPPGVQCDHDVVFAHCVSSYVDGLTDSCLHCERRRSPFENAQKDCKAACLLGWCKAGCLDCIFPGGAAFNYTNPCDGTTQEIVPPSDPCALTSEEVVL